MTKTPEQAAVERARELVKRKPKLEAELRKLWNEVCDVFEAHHKGKKVFEVHHMNEVARAAFLAAFVEHGAAVRIKQDALTAVGL